MPLFAESKDKIFGDILVNIIDNTNITKVSLGSKTRAIAEAVSNKLGQAYRRFDLNVAQSFLIGAEGQYLDFIGDMMGVPRLEQETAQVTSTERNIRFYVETGTFGDINGGNSITITSGTTISTGPAGTGITYTVPYNVVLLSTATETYVAVRADQTGTNSNIGARQLRYHNFTDYSDTTNDSLKVINDAEIVKGQDGETDTNYRFRISQQVTASEQANFTSIRLAALQVPGVADLTVLPFFRGIGTFDMLIKATTPTIPTGLLAAVEEALTKVSAQGILVSVRGPVEIGTSLTGTIILKKKIEANEENNLIRAVTLNVEDYINSLDIGEDFVINEVLERAMSTSDLIKTIGSAGKPFDNIYIYRPTKLQDNKIRNTLLTDYSPEEDERIIVEQSYAGSTPILFTVANRAG